ncbi:hypothetical protein QTJ16_006468 [Diplocarpon rosae]|uniref:Uncharacterized protein n=1 Tax=Diplocarpon rosae TaxID=946125 RepID=A0AAD9STU7_9HELO|nr:hypothetical protein QTJ16_006468 [Diplocarpon rosae]
MQLHTFLSRVQADYYEAVHQTDFWDFSVRSFASFRPGKTRKEDGTIMDNCDLNAVVIGIKPLKPPSQAWSIVGEIQKYQQVVTESSAAERAVDTLLYMSPADRVAFAMAERFKHGTQVAAGLLAVRKVLTLLMWDQAEILARGNVPHGGYNIARGL